MTLSWETDSEHVASTYPAVLGVETLDILISKKRSVPQPSVCFLINNN
jgi:hypothetical protein